LESLQTHFESLSQTVIHQDSLLTAMNVCHENLVQTVVSMEDAALEISGPIAILVSNLDTNLCALENRFLKFIPILTQLRRQENQSGTQPAPREMPAILSRLQSCEEKLSTMETLLHDTHLQATEDPRAHHSSSKLESSLLEIQAQMKQLQLCVAGKGVQIANKTFQSFDKVKTWVTCHLPNRRYGLFVDGISIFEFFSHGHVDAEIS